MRFPGATRRRVRGGCLVKLLLLGALAALLAVIAWAVLLPSLLVSAVHARTGFELQIQHLSLRSLSLTVVAEGLVLRNPADWPAREFVELRRFKADVKLLPLLADRFEADEVVLDVARLTLVRHPSGQLNAVAFKERLTGPAPATAAGGPEAKRTFLIRRLDLRLDQLVYADHSGRRPVVKTYDVGLRRDLRDVDSVAKVISPFTGTVLGLLGEAVTGMFPGRRSVLDGVADLLQGAGRKTGETLKGFMESLEKWKPKD